MRYLMHKTLRRLGAGIQPAAYVLLGASALAGVAFVYTVNQFYNENQVGTGTNVNLSFLPEDLSSSLGLVLATLLVSMFTTLFASRGDFLRGIAVLFSEGGLTLGFVGIAYVAPGLLGETAYLQDYYAFVMKQLIVVAITMFPLMLVGGVTGMILFDKIGDLEDGWLAKRRAKHNGKDSFLEKKNSVR